MCIAIASHMSERHSDQRIGVLLMAHGTPESVDQMTDYLRLVRGGREPSTELIKEMTHNWEAIGGRSPLTDITMKQGAALKTALERNGLTVPVTVGMRNWKPFIADAMKELIASGVSKVIGIPLAPQFSTLSVQKYTEAAKTVLPEGVELSCVQSFHDHPLLAEAFAEKIRQVSPSSDEEVIFTAHSLPQRVAAAGDPYPDEVSTTAKLVAQRAGIQSFLRAYQSAGRTPEPWLGPDLSELIRARAGAGVKRILVVPIGFVCDHTEILFDIDVQATQAAREVGVTLRRTQSLNTSPTFIRTLAALVAQAVPTPA
jgi:ferrochelatase